MAAPATPTPLGAFARWIADKLFTLALAGGLIWGYHRYLAPRPEPDALEVAAAAELRTRVAMWGTIQSQLAAGTLKPAAAPAALANLKTAAATALADAIRGATDPAAAYGKVAKVQAGMLK